jgi:hypothetical protein
MANFPLIFGLSGAKCGSDFRSSDHYKKLMTAAINQETSRFVRERTRPKETVGDHLVQVPGGLSPHSRIGCGAFAVRPVR